MIEGLTKEVFMGLPVQERTGLFMEEFYLFAAEFLTDPQDMERVRSIAHQTAAVYSGRLSPEEVIATEAQIQAEREAMYADPDQNVVAYEYATIAALYFMPEIEKFR